MFAAEWRVGEKNSTFHVKSPIIGMSSREIESGRRRKNHDQMKKKRKIDLRLVEIALRKHFAGHQLHNLVSASRTFPSSARVDLQSALQKLLPERAEARQFGVHSQYDHSTLTFANLMGNTHDPAIIAPMQYEEIDIGETLPARCLRQALWLSRMESTPFALLLSLKRAMDRQMEHIWKLRFHLARRARTFLAVS